MHLDGLMDYAEHISGMCVAGDDVSIMTNKFKSLWKIISHKSKLMSLCGSFRVTNNSQEQMMLNYLWRK